LAVQKIQTEKTMMDPSKACLFIPPGLAGFKQRLFGRIGGKMGRFILADYSKLAALPDDIIPVVGCTPELKSLIAGWRERGRTWIYWDRGYCRRVFATDLPRGEDGGMYRWHINSFQMTKIDDVPDDRWLANKTELWPWQTNGDHIVVAEPSPTYARFHGIENWTQNTISTLKALTSRPIVVRDKEMQRNRPYLHEHLKGAHCLVTHGSNAAVEAVFMGCPVFVHPDSAAALVGLTDLTLIEHPIFPDRLPWVKALSYHQFDERELVDGTLWALIS
jgi:hypothetical protein